MNHIVVSDSRGVARGLEKTVQSSLSLLDSTNFFIDMEGKERILMQMEALGMMRAFAIGRSMFHQLTDEGLSFRLREDDVTSSK